MMRDVVALFILALLLAVPSYVILQALGLF